MRSSLSGVILAWLLVLLPSLAAAACRVETLASVPITLHGGTPLVTLTIDGQPSSFILDTGAERSVISEAAAQRLGLRRDEWAGTTMGGIGGVDRRPNALPRSLSLDGVALARTTLSRDTSLAVTPGLRGVPLDLADGLLGRDFLAAFDLDLDVPGRRLGLVSVRDCPGSSRASSRASSPGSSQGASQARFLPWQAPYAAAPATMAMGAVLMTVTLDGISLRAMLDSGATSSLLAAPGMFKLKLDLAHLDADRRDTVNGVGPRSVVMRRHRFATLAVAGQTAEQPEIWVAPAHLVPIADMLLGMDWLSGHRVWISNATRQVFVQTGG